MSILTFYTISKREIDQLDFTRFDSAYSDWPKLCGAELRSKYNSLLLAVDGFDNNPEEIYMIPEVRQYFRELHRRWPWFLFFLYDYDATLAMPYLCLLDSVECIRRAGSDRCGAIYNPHELLPFMEADFERMNYLFERADLPESENDKRTRSIFATFIPNPTAQ